MCEITHAVCIASEVKFASTIEMCQCMVCAISVEVYWCI